MSIYRQVLGENYNKLHPMLQRRYAFENATPFMAKGVMKNVYSGPRWLYPLFILGTKWDVLFPEYGQNIPFQIKNTPLKSRGDEEQVLWEREFIFGKKKRYFNALMSLDEKRNVIKDYFGEPPVFYSDLALIVTEYGGLIIESKKQRIVLGKLEIPLPKLLQGKAIIKEEFDEEKGIYFISVTVNNPLIGRLFGYEGEFVQHDIS
ncbi:DUF4166 domain-containing protein [Ornithinibacillus salinisoli]|uniref:DUF4166 domain-containing protein n=1 Tax=Ornithinibacillus salinisoli TaxID=1848459 RepID=A0ABW4VXR8_9BACI